MRSGEVYTYGLSAEIGARDSCVKSKYAEGREAGVKRRRS